MTKRIVQSGLSSALGYDLKDILHTSNCPACGYYVAVSFYKTPMQPLTTLAWPASKAEAQSMKRLPLTFVRCVDCGHVYNKDFDYAEVPYSKKPNLMFNQGILWQAHLAHIRDQILSLLPDNPTVVEIGCGEGHLLRALAGACPNGRFIGFDPDTSVNTAGTQVEAIPALFEPAQHYGEYQPDLIISRHVLEHLMNPLGFVQSLAFAINWYQKETTLFIEVPCIDRVFGTARATDFFYEHNSHFTTTSLTRMLERCAVSVEKVERGYNDEVVYAFAKLGSKPAQCVYADEALSFMEQSQVARKTVTQALAALYESGQSIALWGGTGKSAAFINRYSLDADRFPLVVDSDRDKVGTHVPGTGQWIDFVEVLQVAPVDVILITTQWRASDILLEIQAKGISFKTLLIEHDGHLIDYVQDTNPY